MSNETMTKEEQDEAELAELKKQIEQVAEEEQKKADESPSPETEPESSPAPEPSKETEAPVTPKPEKQVDPVEWAKGKGLTSPEDMARALLQKEQEFHKRNQNGHPGYRDIKPDPVVAPEWQPRPETGFNGYMPPPQYIPPPMHRPDAYRDVASMYPDLPPEDVRRLMPLIVDAAEAISNRKMASIQGNLAQMQREQERNKELMTLMQDPAFRDQRVQKEVHQILDSDPTIFQREPTRAFSVAYQQAMVNLARKQLQQDMGQEPKETKPPVTAGGGNGSAHTAPTKITEQVFNSWSLKEQEAFLKTGRVPRPKS